MAWWDFSVACVLKIPMKEWSYALGMDADEQPGQLSDAELIERLEGLFDGFFDHKMPDALRDAVDYALSGGGKRVRPLLCLRSYFAAGGAADTVYADVLTAAGAVELIHTFSLVHDDLPAMDDDDLRRGRPTLHKHTSEAMAVLAGDAMTALAFEMIAVNICDAVLVKQLVAELASATNGMIAGQVYDMMGGQPEALTPIDRLRLTHWNKTGALLYASIKMGAICGGATDEQIEALGDYAGAVGHMFQAVDDLLDVTQSAEKMGKATGKDAGQGKLTYPGLLGIDGTRAEIDKLLTQALEALSGFDAKADPLRGMAQRLATRQK